MLLLTGNNIVIASALYCRMIVWHKLSSTEEFYGLNKSKRVIFSWTGLLATIILP